RVFRALTHFDRFSQSLDRMALPALSQELFFKSLEMLLSGDAKKSLNVDFKGGQCLYLRPIICNATNKLGPVMSEEFHFALFTAPLLINPYGEVKLMIETEKSRAAKGGVATAKTAGNYAAGAKVVIDAQKKGYKHVAFTDASSHLYFEECGSTNLYFIWNGKIVTPSLDEGTILNGVTRRTILEVVAPDLGLQVEERKVFVQEVRHAILDKDITEVFVSGTACTNTPVVGISYKGLEYDLPPYHNDSITFQIHRAMNAIYVGETHIGLTAGHVY
ncbi:MAG: branched-chain amino acid aminotransferase, partial [Patescibacteria group bacterium]|nr:branched-chain amino acid aminotransferase [Patescibacteria group bacterium]